MIFFITLISCFLILLLLIIWKRKLIKDLFQNRKDPKVSKLLGVSIPTTLIALLFTIYGLPVLLKNIISFKTYEDYLFWNEYYEITDYAELEEGVAYSLDKMIFSGFLYKEGEKVKESKINSFHEQTLEDDNGNIIYLEILELVNVEQYLVLFIDWSGKDFNIMINNEQASLLQNKGIIKKVSVIEKTESIAIIYNGEDFVLELD